MCFKQNSAIFTLNDKHLKLEDHFSYLGSNISSTEIDISIHIVKALTAMDRPSAIWKSIFSGKIKHEFFQTKSMSVLFYGCTTGNLTIRLEKKINRNSIKILRSGRDLIVIVVGNGHSDTSSILDESNCISHAYTFGKVGIQLFSLQLRVISRADWVWQPI